MTEMIGGICIHKPQLIAWRCLPIKLRSKVLSRKVDGKYSPRSKLPTQVTLDMRCDMVVLLRCSARFAISCLFMSWAE